MLFYACCSLLGLATDVSPSSSRQLHALGTSDKWGHRDSVDGLTFEGQELPVMRGGETATSEQNSERTTTLKLGI